MIIRPWQENGDQMHMFQSNVYCRVCKRWSIFWCVNVGDFIECGNPSCSVKGILVERHGVLSLGRHPR